jgi:peptidyl-prolyl cis-trans isomerase D
MLQSIHEKVKGWFATTMMAVIALTFALFGVESYLGNGTAKDIVAKVNGYEISANQLTNAYQRLRQTLFAKNNATPVALNQTEQAKLKKQALQQLITTQVLTSAASARGYRISPAQVDDVIMQLPAFQVDGKFSPARFQQILDALGYSQASFLAELEDSLLINQVQNGVMTSSFGLPNEAAQTLSLLEQKRNISYTIIPSAQFLTSVNVPDSAITTYYQQHQDQFKTPAKVSIQYIVLSAAQLAKSIVITPQQLQHYYQNNLSAYQGNGKTVPFSEVKDKIAKLLQQQKLQEMFSEKSQKLSDLTYTNSNSLQPAANTLDLTVQSTGLFTQDGDKTGILANPQVIAAAFSDDVLKNSNNSNVIPLSDSTLLVLRVNNSQPSAVQSRANVKSGIEQELRAQMAQQRAQQLADQAITDLKSGASLESLAAKYHFTWNLNTDITRQTPQLDSQIVRTAFDLSKPASATQPAATATVMQNGNVALVVLQSVQNQVVNQVSAQQQHIVANEIENAYAQLDYQLYVAEMMNTAKIKILTK